MEDKKSFNLSSGLLEKMRFIAVGLANTAVDFVMLNVLTSALGVAIIPANLVSTFAAMCFSLLMNRHFVFKTGKPLSARELILFTIVTLMGIWVVQSIVISLLTEAVPAPLTTIAQTIHSYGITRVFTVDFLVRNEAKVIATVFSLLWNYFLYKYVVFANKEQV